MDEHEVATQQPGIIGQNIESLLLIHIPATNAYQDHLAGGLQLSRDTLHKEEQPRALIFHLTEEHYYNVMRGKVFSPSVPTFDMQRMVRDMPWMAGFMAGFFVGTLLGTKAAHDQLGLDNPDSQLEVKVERLMERIMPEHDKGASIDNVRYVLDEVLGQAKQVQTLLSAASEEKRIEGENSLLCGLSWLMEIAPGIVDTRIEQAIIKRYTPAQRQYQNVTRDFTFDDLDVPLEQLRKRSTYRKPTVLGALRDQLRYFPKRIKQLVKQIV